MVGQLSSVLSVVDRRAAAVAAASEVVSSVSDVFAPPDPVGWAEVSANGQPLHGQRLKLQAQEDTFTPFWHGPPTWRRVPLVQGMQVAGELLDDDTPLPSDPMGRFTIGYDELVAALQERTPYQARIAEQTYNQILFVGIHVTPD